MRHLYFVTYPADIDISMRPAKKINSSLYYEYIILYTYDNLVISEHVKSILRKDLGDYFELEERYIDTPKIYLGG